MNKLLPLSIACALSLAACTDGSKPPTDEMPAPATAQPAMPTPQSAPDASNSDDQAQRGDGFALGLLATIDQHEIDVAQQARDKHVTGEVLAYADMMAHDHGENLQKTQALGPDASDPDIAAMKQKGEAELQMLGTKSGADYAKAYIQAMIDGHQEALAAIDGKMLPAATRDDVKQHLADTRKAVEAHLAKAKDIAGRQ